MLGILIVIDWSTHNLSPFTFGPQQCDPHRYVDVGGVLRRSRVYAHVTKRTSIPHLKYVRDTNLIGFMMRQIVRAPAWEFQVHNLLAGWGIGQPTDRRANPQSGGLSAHVIQT